MFEHIPVLVVGGGPAGLATAAELAHHGVRSLVVEPRQDVSWLRPRAKTTSARTMELFRRWGLAETVRARAALPVSWSDQAVFTTGLLNREITRFHGCFGLDLTGDDLVAEPGQQVSQPTIERVLREAVTGSISELRLGWSATALSEDPAGVTAVLSGPDGEAGTVRADYVVGADGAWSTVRAAIGAEYEGSADERPNFNIVFRAPGLAERVPHGPAVHYWVLHPEQPGLVGRLDLEDTWWCIAQGVTAEDGERDPLRIVRALVGADIDAEIIATDPWKAKLLLADRYGTDRVFLAGDAAHLNPPWGGHGFNTGIGDAVNLGWKLAAVLNGWAPTELLASYETERKPVAAQTIAEAARNMATLAPELTDERLAGTEAEFESIRPAVAAAVQRAKDGEFHSLDLVLGYSYRGSPLVIGEAGGRLPHRWLGPGDSLYDHLGDEFSLVGDLTEPIVAAFAEAAAAEGIPLKLVDHPATGLALVRPDQHVAWAGDDPRDPREVLRRAIGHPSPHLVATSHHAHLVTDKEVP
ncbi:2-polyprenyl-6-methoxyphenol hydroxylase-like FAD-dependent oxidoreductase [Nocardia tenerifensis]|uniref:2-polyprenyl-6-methoxyphenol hydroxylase-like FAD-dependent oxidoreductase n=1 Tax=Nocardia tenerifensis TaxID=228006 RepID=A0A318KAC4_9NOCA|nr:FAD-dependent monooxygenase [Nocardia tenerifensis]PXX71511.1 2-polyprenyl-6-methoxyphenol hydroxylase-like FAD-dependent oxidoreductase [Nocardia tenerifensis]